MSHPWSNCRFNADANTGHGFAIFMPVLVPYALRAPAPVNWVVRLLMKKLLSRVTGKPSYTILDPVVDLLLANGNTLANEYRWGSNPTGYFCELKNPVDFQLVESNFELPSGLQLIKKFGHVDYGLGTVVIFGPAT